MSSQSNRDHHRSQWDTPLAIEDIRGYLEACAMTRALQAALADREVKSSDLKSIVADVEASFSSTRPTVLPWNVRSVFPPGWLQKNMAQDGLQGGASKRPISDPNSLLPRARTL